MIGPIDLIEFRMTSNTAEHLAQSQYRVDQYNYCLGTRSNASSSVRFQEKFVKSIINCYDRRLSAKDKM